MQWIAELEAALDAEFPGRPRVAALATVDERAHPRVRHVILRQIDPAGRLLIVSDARSGKNRHIRCVGFAALAFWLPSVRCQWRIEGSATLLTSADQSLLRTQVWRELPDATRAMFTWPSPGQPRDGGEFADALDAQSEIPEVFEVIALAPDRVESLNLNHHPHLRRQWKAPDSEPQTLTP